MSLVCESNVAESINLETEMPEIKYNQTSMVLVRCGSQYTDVLEFYCYSIGGAKEFLLSKEKEGLFPEAERDGLLEAIRGAMPDGVSSFRTGNNKFYAECRRVIVWGTPSL